MDWIERWLGFAPDNGDGSLELLLLLIVACAAVAAIMMLHPRSQRIIQDICRRNLQNVGSRRSG
jgi:hypothetical protein